MTASQSTPDMFIWVFDYNYRDYTDNDGNRTSTVNYAKQWRKRKVVDETSRSWILDSGLKIPKKPKVIRDFLGNAINYLMTQEEVDDQIWRHDNLRKLVQHIERTDTELLRRIAVMTGFEK